MDWFQNKSLKSHNTFGVDVSARYYAEVRSEEDLISALKNYRKLQREVPQFPLLFLGGGSNVLFLHDFAGLVVKLNIKGIKEEIVDENHVLISSGAGENWHDFVMYCLGKNYGGLENLSLIPGNVGTSPMQNIGAYGTEIKDHFATCKVLNLETLETENFNNEQCRFGYRDSIFKRECKGKYVILEVSFLLTTRQHLIKTRYGAVQQELEKMNVSNPTIDDVSAAVISIRRSKLPNPAILGNAGSFFKNPTISLIQYEDLQKENPNMPSYPSGDLVKIPAGWLIEQCGWKGRQLGNVACHELQALVIVNKTGKASGQEIYEFSEQIIRSVKEKFGIELEREVNVI